MSMWQAVLLGMIFAYGQVCGRVTITHVSEQDHYLAKRDISENITNAGDESTAMRTAVLIYTGELDKDPTLLCSGTLLSEDIIITAATCFDAGLDDVDDFSIVAGDLQAYLAGQPNTAEKIGVQGVSIHPHYDHDYDYDYVPEEEPVWNMAIVQFKRKVNLDRNPNMEAAMLPPPGMKPMKHTGKLVQFGAPDGSVYLLAKEAVINPDEHCHDELVEGMFLLEKVCGEKKKSSDCEKIAAGSPAIYRGWKKPLVIGLSKFLPWIFRETRLRPSYEVFDDDKLFEEYHRDVTLQSSLCSNDVEAEQITDKSPDVMVDSTPLTTTGPLSNSESMHSIATPVEGSKLYLEENGRKFYGIPIADGTTIVEGAVPDTCANAGMRAVCNGGSSCQYSGARCEVVDFENGCGHVMHGLSKKLCSGKIPQQCPQMDGLFTYLKGKSGRGYVSGKYTHGKDYASGNGKTFYAYCVQQ